MNSYIGLVLFLIITRNTLVSGNLPQRILQNPQHQQARIGDQVILKCQIENLAGEPQWCIDDFCLGLSKDIDEKLTLKGRPRHKIIGIYFMIN